MKAGWGLATLRDDSPYCWGARAIYHPSPVWDKKLKAEAVGIDIVWDRQEFGGESTSEERKALLAWLNTEAMDRLRVRLAELSIYGSSSEIITIEGDRYFLTASPRESYGYLYMVAEPKEGT